MARTINKTATLNSSKIQYLAFDAESKGIITTETYSDTDVSDFDAEKLLKFVRNKIDVNAVQVLGVEQVSDMYGMSDDTFMKIASRTSEYVVGNINRSIKTTLASISFIDTDNIGAGIQHTTIAIGDAKTDDSNKLLAIARKAFETNTLKVVQVTDTFTENAMYTVSKQKFVANAEKLDAETRKAIEAEAGEE